MYARVEMVEYVVILQRAVTIIVEVHSNLLATVNTVSTEDWGASCSDPNTR